MKSIIGISGIPSLKMEEAVLVVVWPEGHVRGTEKTVHRSIPNAVSAAHVLSKQGEQMRGEVFPVSYKVYDEANNLIWSK